ncbi:helix-turn-helix domain-containing protein [Ponticoccus sp. SC2-23]|uniref:transcriptional regulator FnrL n=1 Tax=Alexandriicola marinus TaxID=2081710 RepID=UPI000FDB65CC|nr:helix-turn-helix domain-containing protein [Alexandriicola marinus]MBM1219876.1 helix-turn-helix domain-containing protein [Ponticoccus sp. SC6-9]MBM1224562.1 helix-turn-helix domain-containing protein [Ponticoccus sp. SC6-15]MBM1228075.1 helix-turn-helix domain-containing protein [Ponticoccus sp. SC6-38]MBM1234287.1 helix-turn-helix domain-containing protein [Ponticoccus sp. SC6-45]MBM1238577.1 helix-turn-helix domain-containing protein [Ponticoccus sp. SC6-49]MBM1242358.1 helix-turn-heli
MNLMLNERIKCSECPIRHRAVCSRCDDEEITLLESMKMYRSYKPGETILWRGDDLQFVASVVKGVASLSKTLEDGRTQMVGLLLPSDFIGRPGRETVEFDITAITDVTLCCFRRKPFEEMIQTTPHIAQRLMEIALDELDAARDWMLLLGRKTAREKIATFLEMLVRRTNVHGIDANSSDLTLPLTRDEIANYLGLTLETVSRQLNALKNEGMIRFVDRRHFEVVDLLALHEATGDDADGGLPV